MTWTPHHARPWDPPANPVVLSPAMFRARVSLQTAQAHLDAIRGDAAAKAWAEVWDAFHAWVVAAPPT